MTGSNSNFFRDTWNSIRDGAETVGQELKHLVTGYGLMTTLASVTPSAAVLTTGGAGISLAAIVFGCSGSGATPGTDNPTPVMKTKTVHGNEIYTADDSFSLELNATPGGGYNYRASFQDGAYTTGLPSATEKQYYVWVNKKAVQNGTKLMAPDGEYVALVTGKNGDPVVTRIKVEKDPETGVSTALTMYSDTMFVYPPNGANTKKLPASLNYKDIITQQTLVGQGATSGFPTTGQFKAN